MLDAFDFFCGFVVQLVVQPIPQQTELRESLHVLQNLACDKNRAGLRTAQLSINSSLAALSHKTSPVTFQATLCGWPALFLSNARFCGTRKLPLSRVWAFAVDNTTARDYSGWASSWLSTKQLRTSSKVEQIYNRVHAAAASAAKTLRYLHTYKC